MMNIDLRLLGILAELRRTRSVSHTAENLGLSQSAVSMSLARLRKHFSDPLFVRTSKGMEPTPYADERGWSGEVHRVWPELAARFGGEELVDESGPPGYGIGLLRWPGEPGGNELD